MPLNVFHEKLTGAVVCAGDLTKAKMSPLPAIQDLLNIVMTGPSGCYDVMADEFAILYPDGLKSCVEFSQQLLANGVPEALTAYLVGALRYGQSKHKKP